MHDPRTIGLFAQIDQVLAGNELQRSDESAPGRTGDGCVRCRADLADAGDICGPCRAFLLGDTDIDPVTAVDADDLDTVAGFVAQFGRPGPLVDRVRAGELAVLAEDGRVISGAEAIELLSQAPPSGWGTSRGPRPRRGPR